MENKVIAIVDGREITEEHYEHLVKTIGPDRMEQFANSDARSQLVQELINQELFYSYAMANDMQNDPEYLQEVKLTTENLLKSFAIRKFLEKFQLEDGEVDDYYNNNKELFVIPEKASAQHILVRDRDTIKELKQKLAAGADFGELAKQYSTCPSKERGGDLGEFNKGQMVPEFEEVAFALEIGEVSDMVETQFGYHLIKLNNKRSEKQQTLDEVRDELTQFLFAQKQNNAYINQVAELKNKYRVDLPE